MNIITKISNKAANKHDYPVPTIAFLGDSVTQGTYEIDVSPDGGMHEVFDKLNVYHSYVHQIFNTLFPACPINIINAGVSGGKTDQGLARLDRDVLSHNPDLTVVCFGLNDCGNLTVDEYADNLKSIFTQLNENGSEVIYMTPNMMNTSVSHKLKEEVLIGIANNTMKKQADLMDDYISGGVAAAKECGVKVCDCYSLWKALNNGGVNTDHLLSNYINHPTREMHWLFAYKLVETMFCE
jgi:lysophospholipase L1-like esterase